MKDRIAREMQDDIGIVYKALRTLAPNDAYPAYPGALAFQRLMERITTRIGLHAAPAWNRDTDYKEGDVVFCENGEYVASCDTGPYSHYPAYQNNPEYKNPWHPLFPLHGFREAVAGDFGL